MKQRYLHNYYYRENINIDKFLEDVNKIILDSKDSLREIARDIGVSLTTLYNIKNNSIIPQQKIFVHLCKKLNLNTSDYISLPKDTIFKCDAQYLNESIMEENKEGPAIQEKYSDIDSNTYGMFEEQINNINIKDPEIKKLLESAMSIVVDRRERTFKLSYGAFVSKTNFDKLMILVETIDRMASTRTEFDLDFTIKTK